jgi:hypothetical protein
VLNELSEKLEETFRGNEIYEILTLDAPIPLAELFEVID